MENRRTLIAIVLVLFLWSGYNLLFPPKQSVPPQADQKVAAEVSGEKVAMLPPVLSPGYAASENTIPERRIRLHSSLFDVDFSNRGARLVRAQLNLYKQQNTPDSKPVEFLSGEDQTEGYYSLSGGEGFFIPADLTYSCSIDTDFLELSQTDKKVVTFQALTSDKIRVSKTFTFYPNKYYFDIVVTLENLSASSKNGKIILSIADNIENGKDSNRYNFVGPATFDGEKLHNDDIKDITSKNVVYNNVNWTSFTSKYFAGILKPVGDSLDSVVISVKDKSVLNSIYSKNTDIKPNSTVSFKYISFVGPRDFDLLKESGQQFERIIDLGFFGIIAKPLLSFLKFFYGLLGNYGLAIILLTVCIKALFWPLTQKSYSSMKAMQKLQPEMQKLRTKYAKDKQKLNQEMMALYKTHRVNPFGGCLPMVIQIPVFFALYRVLLEAIELRHAPFMLWITDLSAADTLISDALGLGFALGPLPVIMGVTMFLQQKMTPTNMDPTQAKIMLFMPVFFTFIFLSFPSGLVVYWLVNNLLTIAQQYMINRKPA